MKTDKVQEGTWTLMSPHGKTYRAASPIMCCREEQAARVPKEVAAERLITSLSLCGLCNESKYEYILGKGTPAELQVCLTCKNTILQHSVFNVAKNEIARDTRKICGICGGVNYNHRPMCKNG